MTTAANVAILPTARQHGPPRRSLTAPKPAPSASMNNASLETLNEREARPRQLTYKYAVPLCDAPVPAEPLMVMM